VLPILDIVLAPVRLPLRLLEDVHRIANGVEGIRNEFPELARDIDGLREAFEGSNRELAKIREAFTPQLAALHAELLSLRVVVGGEISGVEDHLAEVRETVEPLQGAAKRVGKAVERLPGPGRSAD
jgi:archaellum component FlaC